VSAGLRRFCYLCAAMAQAAVIVAKLEGAITWPWSVVLSVAWLLGSALLFVWLLFALVCIFVSMRRLLREAE
jgi:hypothetical protein